MNIVLKSTSLTHHFSIDLGSATPFLLD